MLIIISDESKLPGQTYRSQEQVSHQDIYLPCSHFSSCLSLVEKVEEPKILLTFSLLIKIKVTQNVFRMTMPVPILRTGLMTMSK